MALSDRPYGVERVRFLPTRAGDFGQKRKDVSECPWCGGTRHIIADSTDPDIDSLPDRSAVSYLRGVIIPAIISLLSDYRTRSIPFNSEKV
jgi:hypothetical protein